MLTLGQAGLQKLANPLFFRPDRCGRKRRHASKGKAEAAIRALIRRELDRPSEGLLAAYHCPRCLSWHVGHRAATRPVALES